jgi:hypothetical protein
MYEKNEKQKRDQNTPTQANFESKQVETPKKSDYSFSFQSYSNF